MEAAEVVIGAGMLQAGCGMLGQLLAADPGYCWICREFVEA
jgi:hypothetical protein